MSDTFNMFSTAETMGAEIMNEPTPVAPMAGDHDSQDNTVHVGDPTFVHEQLKVRHADDLSQSEHEGPGGTSIPLATNKREWAAGMYFEHENSAAFGVFQRAANDANAKAYVISPNVGTKQLVGRVKGRGRISLSVPTTYTLPNGVAITPAGVMWGTDRGSVEAGDGFQLNPGDSCTLWSETPIYINALPGNTTITAVVQYLEETNPVGGSLGAI